MELGHLLTRSGLTYPEVSSKIRHNSFCQLENSVSLPWVIYYEAFYLHVVTSFSCIPVICPELVLFIIVFSQKDIKGVKPQGSMKPVLSLLLPIPVAARSKTWV